MGVVILEARLAVRNLFACEIFTLQACDCVRGQGRAPRLTSGPRQGAQPWAHGMRAQRGDISKFFTSRHFQIPWFTSDFHVLRSPVRRGAHVWASKHYACGLEIYTLYGPCAVELKSGPPLGMTPPACARRGEARPCPLARQIDREPRGLFGSPLAI